MAHVKPPVQVHDAPWTFGRLLAWTTEFFARHHVESPRLCGEILLSHAARCRRIDLYARFDEVLDESSLVRFREWVKRASKHEPIAYLVGEKEFFSLTFHLTPDVLIPRSETETLVECVLDECRRRELLEPRFLDLGTGSGCIAIALLSQMMKAAAVATDVSAAALAVARLNAERHGVFDRLSLIEADGLSLPAEAVPAEGFDFLLANPPYIAESDMAQLDESVRNFEPRSALTDGEDGLSHYRAFAERSPALLARGGWIVVEIGDGAGERVRQTMTRTGALAPCGSWKDRTTGRERALAFRVTGTSSDEKP